MSVRNTPSGHTKYRLGLLTLVADSSVPNERFESWLPRAPESAVPASEVELWLGGSAKRDSPAGSSRLVAGGVAVWIDEPAGRASLRNPAGHAELDLGERWGRVSPRDGPGDLGPLLTASAAILMARAGAALVDASAIIDASGGGWLIVGPREDRSSLVQAFALDGCDYVSDDQVVVRPAHHQAGVIAIESWHRHRDPLPPQKWRPIARLAGVLLARAIVTRTPIAWRQSPREQAVASLIDAAPHLSSDPVTETPLREMLATCATRPTITALMTRDRATPPGGAMRQLGNAVDAML